MTLKEAKEAIRLQPYLIVEETMNGEPCFSIFKHIIYKSPSWINRLLRFNNQYVTDFKYESSIWFDLTNKLEALQKAQRIIAERTQRRNVLFYNADGKIIGYADRDWVIRKHTEPPRELSDSIKPGERMADAYKFSYAPITPHETK